MFAKTISHGLITSNCLDDVDEANLIGSDFNFEVFVDLTSCGGKAAGAARTLRAYICTDV